MPTPPTDETYLHGLMMDSPLTLSVILRRAHRVFPEKQIVSRRNDGAVCRYTYADLYRRVVKLMDVLRSLGIGPGDRVASFGWNSDHHLELYYAVPCLGAVLNTVNIRLAPEQITYILNHAEDRVVFLDRSLAGLLAARRDDIPTVEKFVVMDDGGELPAELPSPWLDYDELMASASDEEVFPDFDESVAGILCYTSGTTGEPKGVLYSHRAIYLHAMGCCMADSFAIREREVVLIAVPMFHANAWGLPYACAMTGATQVLPGSHLLGKPLADLIEQERVTLSAGVPTIWNLLYEYLRQHPRDMSSLKTLICGGSAASQTLIANYARDYGITIMSAWGMTETSPVGSVCRLKSGMERSPDGEQTRIRAKQGLPVANVEMRVVDENGRELPWDGEQAGDLAVRGPWIARSYYNNPCGEAAFTEDGWFQTGDIATIDSFGYMEICDRKKDIIKSRGEWISSVDMENVILSHAGVLEAAVIGRPDSVRDEVPVLFVVARDTRNPPDVESLIACLRTRFARWQVPRRADVHVVPSLPRTSVGKLDKRTLRDSLRIQE